MISYAMLNLYVDGRAHTFKKNETPIFYGIPDVQNEFLIKPLPLYINIQKEKTKIGVIGSSISGRGLEGTRGALDREGVIRIRGSWFEPEGRLRRLCAFFVHLSGFVDLNFCFS